jgi:hypothetical protein
MTVADYSIKLELSDATGVGRASEQAMKLVAQAAIDQAQTGG